MPPRAFRGNPANIKRSYKRACTRASRHGHTWYKGRIMTCQQLQCPPPTVCPRSLTPHDPVVHRPPKLRNRLNIFSWNPSGLARHRLTELLFWLQAQPVHVVALQETRWHQNWEGREGEWHIISSSGTPRNATGLVVLIRRSLCMPDAITWREIIAGRLIHIRLHLPSRPFDIIGAYQTTYSGTTACLSQRAKWCSELHQLLTDLPTRNNLAVVGDFNTTLAACPPHVGVSHFVHNGAKHIGPSHADQSRLLGVIQDHSLTVLNSWRPDAGPTFISNHGTGSRIDHILTRARQADQTSRDVIPLTDFPLLGTHGMGHRPLLCSIAQAWAPASSPAVNRVTFEHRTQCRLAKYTNPTVWDSFVDTSRQVIEQYWPHDGNFAPLHTHLICRFRSMFTTSRGMSTAALDVGATRRKWQLFKELRMLSRSDCTIHRIFRGWKLLAQHAMHQRRQIAHAHEARQIRFDAFIEEARTAANHHNMFALHQVVRKLTPKQRSVQVRFRDPNGRILSPLEEFASIKQFVHESWKGPTLSLWTTTAPGVPFSESELGDALRSLKFMKSTAPGTSPIACISSNATTVANRLFECLGTWWSTSPPFVPQCWKDGHLFLLPKPNKPPKCVENLRPLALQDPIGTAVIGLLTKVARQPVLYRLCSHPQFAYLPHRSTHDSIDRAVQHCSRVRDRIAAFRRSETDHSATVIGGLTISIDLQKAFDTLPRERLFQGLLDLGVPPACVQLLRTWHTHTQYHISHKTYHAAVPTMQGVRQGCKAAPFLWVCGMHQLIEELQRRTSLTWVHDVLTLFADDFLLQCFFTSEDELHEHLQNCGILFDLLEAFGLTINVNKTTVAYSIAGKHAKRIQTKLFKFRADGWFLQLPRAHGLVTSLRTVSDIPYLGIRLSYQCFEQRTMDHRLAIARRANKRLYMWLYSKKKGLTTGQKLQLWQSIVRSTMCYGIWAVGSTQTGLKKMLQVQTTMIRMIYHSHSFDTHTTHEQFLSQHTLDPPAVYMHQSCVHLLRGLQHRKMCLPEDDFIQQCDCHGTRNLLQHLNVFLQGEPSDLVWTEPGFQCQLCPLQFASAASLSKHVYKHHQVLDVQVHVFRYDRDSLDGRPTCRHCLHQFPAWTALQRHIQYNKCASFDHTQAMNDDLQALRTGLWPSLQAGDLNAVLAHPEWTGYLLCHCGKCGKRHGRIQDALHHIQLDHQELALHAMGHYQHWKDALQSPCMYCQVQFVNGQQCKVLLQLALLHAEIHVAATQASLLPDEEARRLSSSDDANQIWAHPSNCRDPDLPLHVCAMCADSFMQLEELHAHLRHEHRQYHCIRDSVLGQPTCNHCKSQFCETWELQRHINRRSCRCHDPLADQVGTLRQDEQYRDALRTGQALTILPEMDDNIKLRMTLCCCMCGHSHTRAADLTRHLQSQHGIHYRAADTMVALIEEFAPTCICNPSRARQPKGHKCMAWRQIGMLIHHLNPRKWALILPWQISESMIARLVQLNPLLYSEAPWLPPQMHNGGLHLVWTTPSSCTGLSHHCSLCKYHDSPDMLWQHMTTVHRLQYAMLPNLLKHIGVNARTHLDWTTPCPMCTLTEPYNLHDETVWDCLQHKCPVVLNLGLALLQTRPDVAHGGGHSHRRGQDAPDGGRLPKHARTHGGSTGGPSGQATQGPSSSGERITNFFHPRQQSEHEQPMSHHGIPPVAARGLDQCHSQSGQLCDVPELRSPRSPSTPCPPSPRVERHGVSYPSPPPTPGSGSDGPTDQALRDLLQAAHERFHLPATIPGDRCNPEGWQLSIPEMESQAQEDRDLSRTEHLPPGHGGTPETDSASLPGTQQPDSVPLPQISQDGRKCTEHGGSMEAAAIDSQRRSHGGGPQLGEQLHMAAGGGQTSDSQLPTLWSSTGTPATSLPTRTQTLREQYLDQLTKMTFHNDQHFCWLNAGLRCALWCLLSRPAFCLADFGRGLRALSMFLTAPTTEPVHVAQRSELASLMTSLPEEGRPRDVAEFTRELLCWMGSDLTSMQWERRFSIDGKIHVEDAGSKELPIWLERIEELDSDCISLATLLGTWVHALSMKSAFLHLTGPKVLHIDRYCMLTPHLGNTHRLLFEDDVQLPFFVWSRSAEPIWIGHRVQSIIIHLGSGMSGHFHAYLRDSKQPPRGWWHCDDNRRPTWIPSLPAIAQNVWSFCGSCPSLRLRSLRLNTQSLFPPRLASVQASPMRRMRKIIFLMQRMNSWSPSSIASIVPWHNRMRWRLPLSCCLAAPAAAQLLLSWPSRGCQ